METLKSFTHECMLFRSADKINWLFGSFMWIDAAIAIYSITEYITTYVL